MRIRRKILRNIIILVVLVSVTSTWYINAFLAPRLFKDYFIKTVSNEINRPVSLDSLKFSLIHGFILKNLSLYEPDQKTAFLQIKELHTSLLFIPFIKGKKIIIPYINIVSPEINVIKNEDNTWNFSTPSFLKKESLNKRMAPSRSTGSGFSVIIEKINFNNGRLAFTDKTRHPAYSKQLVKMDGEVSFSSGGNITFNTTSQLDTPEKTNIAVTGTYNTAEKILTAQAALKNLSLLEPYTYFKKITGFADLKKGLSDLSFNLKVMPDKKFSLDINASVKDAEISRSGLTLRGDLGIAGIATLDLTEKFEGSYRVTADFRNAGLSGVSILNEVSKLNGKITLSNNGLSCEYLWGEAYGVPIKFSGQIADFKKFNLTAQAQADIELSKYKNFLTQNMKQKFRDLDLRGPAEVRIKYTKCLRDPLPGTIEGDVKLKGVDLKTPLIAGKIEKISGAISFENDIFYILRMSFKYRGQNNILDAKIKNLALPDVLIKFRNNDLFINSRFGINKNTLHILRAAGNYLNSPFTLAGDVTDLKDPFLDISGNVNLDLMDLRKVLPKISGILARFDVKGKTDLDFHIKGPAKEVRMLNTAVRGTSDRISAWGLKFDDIKLNIKMEDGILTVPEFSARPYNGTLMSKLEMDLNQSNPQYSVNIALEGVDLSRLVKDTNLKDKPITGTGLAKLNLRGYGKNTETIKGEAFILIRGGYLWGLPLLKGVSDTLFLSNLGTVVFDEASADFKIVNKNISTANMVLHSKSINLMAEGTITFDGTIDFLITSCVSEEFIKGNIQFAKIACTLLSEAGQFIGNVKVGGTIKNPEYKFIPLPISKILKDKLRILSGGLL